LQTFQDAGDADVIDKVSADLSAAGVPNANYQVRRMLEQLMTKVMAEIRPTA